MKTLKKIYLSLALGMAAMVGLTTSSCNDNMPSESYYTFTGEMMSDYMKSRPEYSLFTKIVDRASQSQRGVNLLDLLSTYGQYTLFLPTNEAVNTYLKENGYASVDAIPYDVCDTIARTHMFSGTIKNVVDLDGSDVGKVNMNDRYVSTDSAFAYTFDGQTIYVDSTSQEGILPEWGEPVATVKLNNTSFIIPELANDSVENGIVHSVTRVLNSSNKTLIDIMGDNPNISLFTNALEVTGLGDHIRNHIKDASWDEEKKKYEDRSIYSGGQWDYCHVPEQKKFGFTAFACPDEVLLRKYGISNLQDLYNYACEKYNTAEMKRFGDTRDWSGLDVTDPANAELLKDVNCPLRRLVGYNCLNRLGVYDMLTTICTIERTKINPTEWYSTMDTLSTLKCERLTVTRFIGKYPGCDHDTRNDLYLNRGDMSRNCYTPGVHVERTVAGGYDNAAINGYYYTTDGLIDYGTETQQTIFNTRIRMDLYSFFPELMNNSVRDGKTTNSINDSNNPDPNVSSPNYWFPPKYLDNVKVNADGVFLFQSQHNTYWSYEGDEFNLASDVNSYDITMNLPSLPSDQYQIRLGFCAMSTRGICQFYLDGIPQGSPFDQRNDNFEQRTGWFKLTSKSGDDLEASKKAMHNNGFYHGPQGVFNAVGEGVKDENVTNKSYFCDNGGGGFTVRYVLTSDYLDGNKQHNMRIKSIWAVGNALVMIDYIEFVPKSVYGVEGNGKAEDDL